MRRFLCRLGGHVKPSRVPWKPEAQTEWRTVEEGRAKGFIYYTAEYRCQRCGTWHDSYLGHTKIDHGVRAA